VVVGHDEDPTGQLCTTGAGSRVVDQRAQQLVGGQASGVADQDARGDALAA
jgi:hypothetical protein